MSNGLNDEVPGTLALLFATGKARESAFVCTALCGLLTLGSGVYRCDR